MLACRCATRSWRRWRTTATRSSTPAPTTTIRTPRRPSRRRSRDDGAERAVLVCGSGAGVSVAAAKLPGVRAATVHDTYTAHQGVEHDDLNVLCLGARVIGPELARELVRDVRRRQLQRRGAPRRRLGQIAALERDGLDGPPTAGTRSDDRRSPPMSTVPATTPIGRLAELGTSAWLDSIRRSMLTGGELERLVRRGRRRRRHVEPVDLRAGDPRQPRLRRAARRAGARRRRRRGDLLDARDRGRAGRRGRAAPGLGAHRRASTATSRSRSRPTSRATPTRRSRWRATCGRASTART